MQKSLNNFIYGLFLTGVCIISIYILFQIIAISNPQFSQTYIFNFFDIGAEVNLPTFFSVLLLVLLSAGTFILGKLHEKKDTFIWMSFSALLMFLALDEFAQIHEQFTEMFQHLLSADGFLFFAWVIPYGIALIVLSFFYIPFLLKLPKKTKMYLLLGAGIFVLGAIGFEMIGAKLYQPGTPSGMYIVVSSIEEILEITGLLIALKGVVHSIGHHGK